ncbi:MAG: hypothetical protein ABR905_13890 [Terracidiphilus sp.]|jgi:hypothetical protein
MADLFEMVFGTITDLFFEAVSQDGSESLHGLQTALNEKSNETIIALGLSIDP